jgi:hypothetical protein
MASTSDRTYNFTFAEFYLDRISLLIISQNEFQSYLLCFECLPTYGKDQITVRFLCLRFRQRTIERVMDLTYSFMWEDLPTRDADTGQLTAAGWIPLTMKFCKSAAIANVCFHTVQSTIRIVTNHETILTAWYPFDWTISPFYELVNISQVLISRTKFSLSVLIVFFI